MHIQLWKYLAIEAIIHMYVCMCVCTCVYVYICMYVYVCIHIPGEQPEKRLRRTSAMEANISTEQQTRPQADTRGKGENAKDNTWQLTAVGDKEKLGPYKTGLRAESPRLSKHNPKPLHL